MANTEGGRLNRSIHKQVYFNRSPAVIESQCTPAFRTTLSTETTQSQGTLYAQNLYRECVAGQSNTRITYQGGVSQEEIAVLLSASRNKTNYASESARVAAEECSGYIPAFSDVIPPIIQCLPLPPPPAPPMDPGANPTRCR
jgi:hypothetical protein